MAKHKGSRKRSWKMMSLLGVFSLLVTMSTVAAGVAFAAPPLDKVFVCKYVGTPSVSERLQTGQNPISTSANAIPGVPAVGAYFADEHGRSYILVEDTGQPEPDVGECPRPVGPTDECPDLDGNQPPGTDCTEPLIDRETRDLPGVVDCEADTYTIEHQDRVREYSWDGDSWELSEWTAWTTFNTTVTEATDEQCPPTPVINPGGSIKVDCTGGGIAHADNSASTTSFGFEVVVNGVATLYTLEAGEVRDIPFSGAQPGNTVILQDGEANVIDAAYVPPKCEEPPSQCPDDTNPGDVNGDGVVDDADCAVIPPHPSGDVTVASRCGYVLVTNNEDRVMRFEYGSFGSLDGPDVIDDVVTVQPGKTVKVETTRESLDWHAEGGGLVARGIDLAVPQDCGHANPSPASATHTDHPTVAPHAGGTGGVPDLGGLLMRAGGLLLLFFIGALAMSRRRGVEA